MSSIDGAETPRGDDGVRLVAVLAHPDDETFVIGGAIAFYAARGVDVRVVYGRLARRRTARLRDKGRLS